MAAPTPAPTPAIQIIEKANPTKQHIVPLLSPTNLTGEQSTTLNKNTVFIRTKIISLTNNTLTYAQGGGRNIPGLDWWNVWPFPLPSTLPSPFNSDDAPQKYCRIAAWGYSTFVESSIPDLPVGTDLFGYQPIGTAVESLRLKPMDGGVPGGWMEVSERRQPAC